MTHRLKIIFTSGAKVIKLDGQEISTIKAIRVELKSPGISLESQIFPTNNSFTCKVIATEGEMEFIIPDQVADALS